MIGFIFIINNKINNNKQFNIYDNKEHKNMMKIILCSLVLHKIKIRLIIIILIKLKEQ